MVELSDVNQEGRGLEDLVHLRTVAEDHSIERAVEAVREFLAMDVAYATTMTASVQRFDTLCGDGESFGIYEGMEMEVDQTYCERVLASIRH